MTHPIHTDNAFDTDLLTRQERYDEIVREAVESNRAPYALAVVVTLLLGGAAVSGLFLLINVVNGH